MGRKTSALEDLKIDIARMPTYLNALTRLNPQRKQSQARRGLAHTRRNIHLIMRDRTLRRLLRSPGSYHSPPFLFSFQFLRLQHRAPLVRIYAYLAALSALLVTSAGIITTAAYFAFAVRV